YNISIASLSFPQSSSAASRCLERRPTSMPAKAVQSTDPDEASEGDRPTHDQCVARSCYNQKTTICKHDRKIPEAAGVKLTMNDPSSVTRTITLQTVNAVLGVFINQNVCVFTSPCLLTYLTKQLKASLFPKTCESQTPVKTLITSEESKTVTIALRRTCGGHICDIRKAHMHSRIQEIYCARRTLFCEIDGVLTCTNNITPEVIRCTSDICTIPDWMVMKARPKAYIYMVLIELCYYVIHRISQMDARFSLGPGAPVRVAARYQFSLSDVILKTILETSYQLRTRLASSRLVTTHIQYTRPTSDHPMVAHLLFREKPAGYESAPTSKNCWAHASQSTTRQAKHLSRMVTAYVNGTVLHQPA
ncbi:hypothetical protein CSKR_112086, partial [Clonorchis sinensis]